MEPQHHPEDLWQHILEFERTWWGGTVPKELAVRERFGLSPSRYYQLLNRLLDRPEAFEYDPILVRRLKRLREGRRQKRFARRVGTHR